MQLNVSTETIVTQTSSTSPGMCTEATYKRLPKFSSLFLYKEKRITVPERRSHDASLKLAVIFKKYTSTSSALSQFFIHRYIDSSRHNIMTPFFILLFFIHQGSHREVYQEFHPSYDSFRRWCQGLISPQVPCTASPHCPIANSASTQIQQPV